MGLNFIQEFDCYLKENNKGVWNTHKNLKSVLLLQKKAEVYRR